ncbi:HpcH/HpaI aldolase/citrate lyase family protein [Xanthobacter aminoxidans]|uniref:HpcH/HpaI aldolase/citrate lyase family protein n=1 Tax=Xanthobacter aminoxidans TaxID=186280 RepID=UPI002022E87D|nr:CoA ester lyase [Xanthobacter aminoxidans]
MVIADIIVPLFVPAHRPERFAKAAAAHPDAVILDLEDAVPAEAKEAARAAMNCAFTDLPVLVRVNAAGTAWHAADLAAVARLQPAAVLLPKAEDFNVVSRVADAVGPVPVVALMETARGLAVARALAAHPAVARLAFGSVDYCADLGCAHVPEALFAARSELVLASRLSGLPAPIDGVTTALDDAAAAADDARRARTLGLGGKLAIHPRQIAPIRTGFAPDATEIAWAERVLASGAGAVSVDGSMVDEPVRIRARAILARRGGAAG